MNTPCPDCNFFAWRVMNAWLNRDYHQWRLVQTAMAERGSGGGAMTTSVMTTAEFHQNVLSPFIRKLGLQGAARSLERNTRYLSQINAGTRPIAQKLARQFGCILTDTTSEGKWKRYCPDCHEITYHRRVWMEQIPQFRAVQCAECLTVEIELR